MYRYICQDCNEVTGLLKDFTFLPEKSKQQTLVQKRMMQEHIANGDPLFTSCIQAPSLTCKQFHIKPCRVEITRLPKSILCKFQLGEQSKLRTYSKKLLRNFFLCLTSMPISLFTFHIVSIPFHLPFPLPIDLQFSLDFSLLLFIFIFILAVHFPPLPSFNRFSLSSSLSTIYSSLPFFSLTPLHFLLPPLLLIPAQQK